MAGRATLWDWLAGLSGLVLIVSMFTTWYFTNEEKYTAAQKLGLSGKLLIVFAFFAMLTPIIAIKRQTPGWASRYNLTIFLLGLLAIAFIVFRLNETPELDTLDTPVQIETGAYVGLGAAIGIALFSLAAILWRKSRRPSRSAA